MNLEKAKVVITGGSSGLGKATAALLLQKGAQVYICGRDAEKLGAAKAELGVQGCVADVGNEADVVRLITEAHAEMGGLNVLINNAGWGYFSPLMQLEAQPFEQMWRTNVLGLTLCAREAAKVFVQQSYGNIINVASTASLRGNPNTSAYAATKFAVRGMTESWRQELRPHNIRVMLVNPSEVMTDFFSEMVRPDGKQTRTYSEAEQASKLTAQEIAHTIASMLEMDDRGFVAEVTVFATNPQV